MHYPKEVIEIASDWIDGKEDAKNWLLKHNLEELVQLRDAVSRWPKPFEYLLVHKHIILAAFVNAIWEDKKAFQLLMDQKAFHWAAMANYINGDERAGDFLRKSKLGHYVDLAIRIQAKIRKEGDENSNFFNSGPYKA